MSSTNSAGFSATASAGLSVVFFPIILFKTSSGLATSPGGVRTNTDLCGAPLETCRVVVGNETVESLGVSSRDVDEERGCKLGR